MTIEVGKLRYVIAAAENGSFRKAAVALRVEQSSVSRAIRQIEDELGVSLFERNPTGALLTEAGQRLLVEVRAAFEHLELARKSAVAAGRAETGVVRVGILTSLAGGFLRALVHCHTQRYPLVEIDIRDGGRQEHFSELRKRGLDVAFVTGDRGIPEYESSLLWKERVHVALSERHHLAGKRQLDWPELQGELFIVSRFAPGSEVHDYIIRRAADYSTYPKVISTSVMPETLMNLVALGQGITLVSAAWMDVKLPNLVLRPLSSPVDIVPFVAVWPPVLRSKSPWSCLAMSSDRSMLVLAIGASVWFGLKRRNFTSILHLDGHPGSHRRRRRNYTSTSDTIRSRRPGAGLATA